MTMIQPKPVEQTISDDEWERRATQDAIDAAKSIAGNADINPRAMIGSLSDTEWGWIVTAAIFAWIRGRCQQAVAEGQCYEEAIRKMPSRDPQPWEAGAVVSALPSLGAIENLDWSKPLGDWSKEQITSFVWQCHRSVDAALAARDEGAVDKIVRYTRDIPALEPRPHLEATERSLSASAGGPLMTKLEMADMDQEIPF